MKILVLGSDGLIGSYLCDEAVKRGHHVYRSDLWRGYDLRDVGSNSWRADHWDVDLVFFLAFDVGGSQYLAKRQHSYQYLDNNLKIMHNTFTMLNRKNVPFIFASSQMSNMIDSPYGTLKLLGEHLTRSLGGLIVKFWNVYGRETQPEKFHVISDFIEAAKRGVINVKTDGQEERQFLHATDAAQALLILAEKYQLLDKTHTYDITSFEWTSVEDLAHLVAGLVGDDIPVLLGDRKDITQTIKNEPDLKILDIWQPQISLPQGILSLM